jgi:hypothetical protein
MSAPDRISSSTISPVTTLPAWKENSNNTDIGDKHVKREDVDTDKDALTQTQHNYASVDNTNA